MSFYNINIVKRDEADQTDFLFWDTNTPGESKFQTSCWSCYCQVLALISHIKTDFQQKLKTVAAFIDVICLCHSLTQRPPAEMIQYTEVLLDNSIY